MNFFSMNDHRRIWYLAIASAIGGFLFGYDTGIVAGALPVMTRSIAGINKAKIMALVVSATPAGAAIASTLGGRIADSFGRKPILYCADIILAIGAIGLAFSKNAIDLVVFRLVIGMGIGFASE